MERVLRTPLSLLLGWQPFRRRVLFALKQKYYPELELAVPLGYGLSCPMESAEAWNSFTEIFVNDEYGPALRQIRPPRRWLDLGCHAGYFSLNVAWLRARLGLDDDYHGLMIDGDSRVKPAVRKLIESNRLQNRLIFQFGVVAMGASHKDFVERPFMSSGTPEASASENGGAVRRVPTVTADQIQKLLPPPYELVKVDIEGGEYDFLMAYRAVLDQTRHLLLEWHSWHAGGGGAEQLKQLLWDRGFEFAWNSPTTQLPGLRTCGLWLLTKRGGID